MCINILYVHSQTSFSCFIREDLQFWLQENMSDLKLGAPDCLEKHREIKQTVEHVKTQEDQLMDRLTNEQLCLENELKIGKLID